MSTSVFDSVLLKNLWSTEEMRQIFSDDVRMQMWLDYEAALALEQAEMGIIPQAAADEIVACARIERLDMGLVLEQVRLTKHPLVPTIRALEDACSGGFGEYVHFGPTTQDVMDTGMVLQLRMAHKIILRDIKEICRSLLELSEKHRNTPMAGRTLALQAIPITFGHKTAIWLAELMRHHERLIQLEPRLFVGSVVGAVGTKASFGERADELEERVLKRLQLGVPEISWQPARDRFCEYGMVLGMVGATLGKIANEILLLAHNEIDEVAEPFGKGQVGSSTMPHKRNPAITENAACVSNTLKGNIAILLDLMKYTLTGLHVKKDKMRKNLDILGGFMLAERVMFELSEKIGKQTAHELVYEASMQGLEEGVTFSQALSEDPRINTAMTREELEAVLDPTTYVGNAPEQVDKIITQAKSCNWLS